MTLVWCGSAHGDVDLVLDPAENGTVRLDLRGIAAGFQTPLGDDVLDLIELASFAYLADGAISRGSPNAPLAKGWRRNLHLSVPVRQPMRWQQPDQTAALERALSFATEDSWSFDFRQLPPVETQLHLNLEFVEESPTCVLLFSGGLDSLVATLRLMAAGERPLLISHYSSPVIHEAQTRILGLLSEQFGRPLRHVRLHTVRRNGDAREYSQRSRGFMYLALAAAVARQAGVNRVVVGENGVTSLNLAQSAQSPGAMRSRTTHPQTIARLQALLDCLGYEQHIENPLADFTKTDVISAAMQLTSAEVYHSTVSCAHTFGRTKSQPHCGTCSQCVDRRLSGIAAGWEDDLEVQSHEIDLLRDTLRDGDEATYAEHYLRFAADLQSASLDTFVAVHTELWEAVTPGQDPGVVLPRWHQLERRHADQVINAYAIAASGAVPDLLLGKLPQGSLFRRIGRDEHLLENWQIMADRLTEITLSSLRAVAAERPFRSEADVQLQMQAAFAAANERLVREGPTVPFQLVGVSAKPDFSSPETELFVEAKFVKDQASKRKVTEQMLADIALYADHSSSVLFLVWDASNAIRDDREFARAFESRRTGVRVHVLR